MDGQELDLGPVEAHREQMLEDYYLVTLHPTSLKYFADLIAEVKRLREILGQIPELLNNPGPGSIQDVLDLIEG